VKKLIDMIINFGFAILGILFSIFLPGLRRIAEKYRQEAGAAGAESTGAAIMKAIKPYLAIGAFAIVTGMLLMAALGDTINSWSIALLFGYAWESTLDSTIRKITKQ
jgi:hypothetical protein